jgi:hypothetical protein
MYIVRADVLRTLERAGFMSEMQDNAKFGREI